MTNLDFVTNHCQYISGFCSFICIFFIGYNLYIYIYLLFKGADFDLHF